MNNNNNKFCY